MLMPSIFGDNFVDDFFGFPETKFAGNFNSAGMMQTDIAENDDSFDLTMNLPGVSKEDVKAELKDGYLSINASTSSSKEDKDKEGKLIRKERYSGSCSRSFYVGDDVTEQDIKAKFENGTLKLHIPKVEPKPPVETKKYIAIEG